VYRESPLAPLPPSPRVLLSQSHLECFLSRRRQWEREAVEQECFLNSRHCADLSLNRRHRAVLLISPRVLCHSRVLSYQREAVGL